MVSGMTGKNGVNAAWNVVQANITAKEQSKYSQSMAANQSLDPTKKRRDVKSSPALLSARYQTGKTLENVLSAVEEVSKCKFVKSLWRLHMVQQSAHLWSSSWTATLTFAPSIVSCPIGKLMVHAACPVEVASRLSAGFLQCKHSMEVSSAPLG
jgi:hypothetical protein